MPNTSPYTIFLTVSATTGDLLCQGVLFQYSSWPYAKTDGGFSLGYAIVMGEGGGEVLTQVHVLMDNF